MTEISPRQRFEAFLLPMKGEPAWSVRQGTGSFLTLEFGKSVPARGRPRHDDEDGPRPHGERHLWIYCCHWKILRGEEQLALSDSSDAVIRSALAQIEGKELEDILVDIDSGQTGFLFSDEISIQTWPYGDDPGEEQWFVYGGNMVLSFRADCRFGIVEGDVLRGTESWVLLD